MKLKRYLFLFFFIFKLILDNVLAMRLGFYESCIYLSRFFIKEKKRKVKTNAIDTISFLLIAYSFHLILSSLLESWFVRAPSTCWVSQWQVRLCLHQIRRKYCSICVRVITTRKNQTFLSKEYFTLFIYIHTRARMHTHARTRTRFL